MMDGCTFWGFKITSTIHCHYKAWKSQDIFLYNSDLIRLLHEIPYLILVSDAEVLWSLPAACGQVEDCSGGHVGSFGIMGIIIATGGAFSITTVQAGTWGGGPGEWRFGYGEKRTLL